METRANYVIVGIFTLVAIIAAFGFIYWTAAIGDRGETALLRVRIPGSASGLARGSAVLFNGVKVGDVTRVYIDVTNPTVAIADTQIDRLTPITRSTTAVIGIAGLTGQANIEIKGSDLQEPNLLDEADNKNVVAEITADPSAVTNLLQTAQNIFKRADSVISEVEGFTKDVRGPLTQTVKNAQTFSEALARNSEGIDKFLASVSDLSTQITSVSQKLDGTVQAAQDILKAVDPDKVRSVVDNVDKVTGQIAAAGDQLNDIVAQVKATVQSAHDLTENAQNILKGVDPNTIRSVVNNVDILSQRLASASEQFGSIATSVNNVSQKANDLLAAVDPAKVRVVVDNVDTVTRHVAEASGEFTKVVEGVEQTLRSVDDLSIAAQDSLSQVDKIVAGVDPDTVRRTLANIEQTSRTANVAAADISKVTQKVAAHANDIDAIVANATELAQRLNAASVRVDGILVKVDNLLGSGQTEGLVANANATLKSIKSVADNVNGRIGAVLDGLSRFSGEGLRNVDALVRDGRRSISRIEETITDLGRNPQRILSGGDGETRQYDGRVRR